MSLLYTQYQRKHSKPLTTPSGAVIPDPPAYLSTTDLSEVKQINSAEKAELEYMAIQEVETENDKGEKAVVDVKNIDSSAEHIEAIVEPVPENALTRPIALFPQYVTKAPTTLLIREAGPGHFSESFTITDMNTNIELFHLKRIWPSLTHRRQLIDAQTGANLYNIRLNVAQAPRSYRFEDPTTEKPILDLQGNFFVPTQGAKAKAIFMNTATSTTASQGERVELAMRGAWRNRHATITEKSTGEVVANMTSDLLNAKNLVWGRRDFQVTIREGVDMALIIGMIVSLDARTRD